MRSASFGVGILLVQLADANSEQREPLLYSVLVTARVRVQYVVHKVGIPQHERADRAETQLANEPDYSVDGSNLLLQIPLLTVS